MAPGWSPASAPDHRRRGAVIRLAGAAGLLWFQAALAASPCTCQVFAFFVMVVAAAEVVVGLSIVVSIFRTRRSTSVDDENLLKN